MFRYIVVSPSGTPFFQYPDHSNDFLQVDDSLFSGMVSALDSFSFQSMGHSINQMNVGSFVMFFSKDENGLKHVLLSTHEVPTDLAKRIHIEVTHLFQSALTRHPPPARWMQEWQIPENEKRAIFEPFYRSWVRKVQDNKSS